MRTEVLSEKLAPAPAGGGARLSQDSAGESALAAQRSARESRAAPHRMRCRSRSSPSRAVLSSPSPRRQRSPSVSPERHQRFQAPQQILAPFGVGSAYFSPRPPAAPLRLVALGRPGAVISPAAPTTVTTLGSQTPLAAARRRHLVKQLLRELVAALPLPAAAAVPPTIFKPLTVTTCPTVSAADVRDAAVQAITPSKAKPQVRQERGFHYKTDGEKWVGGVRALRDSHVRLVLRQLRHIARLNRALDRAAVERIAQPTAAVGTLPPETTATPR